MKRSGLNADPEGQRSQHRQVRCWILVAQEMDSRENMFMVNDDCSYLNTKTLIKDKKKHEGEWYCAAMSLPFLTPLIKVYPAAPMLAPRL